ncbi:MAG: CbiX/SirB N-terminal domain-containing protein [Pseudomonadota bacterium]|nr:CbiX/SirB N-terminal domain-containing protein [Pseudomonadota bacterium]
MSRALVLFAHGARDPRWAEPFEAVAARLRAAEPGRVIIVAFLELMPPALGEGVAAAVAAGADRVDVVPMFLGVGGHLRNDLPPLVEAVRRSHPGVEIRLHGAIGEQPQVIAALADAVSTLASGPQ